MEKFDTLVALVFGQLYSDFPEPTRLTAESFSDSVVDRNDDEGAFNFTGYFWHTIDWLVDENYVRITTNFSSISDKSYEVVLTKEGLQALRKIPASLQGSEPLGERLISFSKNKGSEAVGTLISLAINTASSAIGP